MVVSIKALWGVELEEILIFSHFLVDPLEEFSTSFLEAVNSIRLIFCQMFQNLLHIAFEVSTEGSFSVSSLSITKTVNKI